MSHAIRARADDMMEKMQGIRDVACVGTRHGKLPCMFELKRVPRSMGHRRNRET